MPDMKTLTIDGQTYEIVDENARAGLENLTKLTLIFEEDKVICTAQIIEAGLGYGAYTITFEEGMTWGDWHASSYNNTDLYFSEWGDLTNTEAWAMGCTVCVPSTSSSQPITPNGEYNWAV